MGQLATVPHARTRDRFARIPPAATGVTDTFTRADNSSSMGNADTGQTWVPGGSGSGSVWGIISNTAYQATNASGGGDKTIVTTIDSGQVARDIAITISTAQSGNAIGGGLVFRWQDVSNFFAFYLNKSFGGTQEWYLQKCIAGTFTTIANGSVSAMTGTLRVVDDGTGTIDVYLDAVLKNHATSQTSLNTKTKQGLIMFYTITAGAASGTGWRFDNYSAA